MKIFALAVLLFCSGSSVFAFNGKIEVGDQITIKFKKLLKLPYGDHLMLLNCDSGAIWLNVEAERYDRHIPAGTEITLQVSQLSSELELARTDKTSVVENIQMNRVYANSFEYVKQLINSCPWFEITKVVPQELTNSQTVH